MSDIYDLYKPIRNCARRCNVSASLIDIWQIANHIHNGTPAPGVPPQDLRSYIHPWDLPIMAREILLNGSEAGVRRLNTPQEIARLVDPIKAAERACIKHRIPRGPDDVFAELIRASHRQFPSQQHRLERSFVRYLKIFGSPELGPVLEAETGLAVEEFFFLGFALAGHLMRRPDINASTSYADFGISAERARFFFGRLSATVGDLKAKLQAAARYDETWELTWNELEGKPLVAIDPRHPERVVCPVPSLLLRRFSGGLYYDLCNAKGFDTAFGESFANYVGEVLAFALEGKPFKVLREQSYRVRKEVHHGADWIVVGSDANLFVECKGKRLSLDAKIAGAGALMEAQMNVIAKAVVQTYKNIEEAEAGHTTHWSANGLPTIPLVVTLEDWFFLGPQMKHLLHAAVLSNLQTRNMDTQLVVNKPYHVMSMQELENCSGAIAAAGIKDFFDGRALHDIWMWTEYAQEKFPAAPRTDFRKAFERDWYRIIPEHLRDSFRATSNTRLPPHIATQSAPPTFP